MRREEHVVTRLVPLARPLLLGRLILGHLLVVPLAIRLSLILVILLLLIGELLPLVAGGRDKAGGGNPLQDGIGIGALQGGGVLLGEAEESLLDKDVVS